MSENMPQNELLKRFEPQQGTSVEYERQLWQARYSPCGRLLVACGYDASIQRWELSEGGPQRLGPLTGHHGWVQAMDFHPTDGRLLTADSWGQLACWPCTDPVAQPHWTLPEAHDGWIRALAVSPDGQWVATGGNDAVLRLWATADGQLQRQWKHPDKIFSLCFHPDGQSLVSGDLQGTLRHWPLEGDQPLRQLDAGVLYQLHRIQQCGGARHLAFDAAGQWLVCAGQKEPQGGFATGLPCVLLFDWKTGQQSQQMQVGDNQDGFVYDARFHPAGFVMATSCAFPGKGHLWFWNLGDEEPFYQSNKIPNGRSLSLHPDGRRLAMLVSLSANANGRPLKDGQYLGGTAKIHLLQLGGADG